jgi:hypothetical protein
MQTAPAYALDVLGDVNVSTTFKVAGTTVIDVSRIFYPAAITAGGGYSPSANQLAAFNGVPDDPSLSANCGAVMIGSNNQNIVLAIGAGTSSGSIWFQCKNRNNSGQSWDIALQPVGGHVGIGMSSVLGSITYNLQLGADSASKPTTSTWTVPSDSRLKRNVKDLVGGLDVITRLRPIEAEYNGAMGLPEGERILSFLAEEIREILPGTVKSHRGKLRETDTEETDILDFNIHEVLIHLVLAVKQLAQKERTN